MANDTVVRAPYNFVPFTTKILEYQDEIPAHNAVDPELRTGEIHVTLTAETPVFVSDGNRDDPHFFRGPDGAIQIPGSTIRGMVRQNMQILGFGLVRPGVDIEDKRFFYRKLACHKDSAFFNLKKHYHTVLKIKTFYQNQKPYAVPQSVQAGYLRKAGDSYQIQPVKGTVLRVSRKHPDVQAFGTEPSRAFPVSYTRKGDRVERIQRGTVPGMEHGFLLYTGRPVGRKPNPLYLFPEADEKQQPVTLERDALINATDLELRNNFLRGGGHNPSFWALPKSGEEKPVFYARWNGHTYFGMNLFLRLRYLNSISDGLPEEHKKKQPDFPDWPRAILGWAGEKKSYRSRVSFGDFPALEDPKEQSLVTTVLSEPRPSYFPSYLKEGRHYDENGFQLRGYKQYWLKETKPSSTGNPSVDAKLRPLPAGTKFAGVIRYKNLRPEELGLLLWAIRLEEDCRQSVGMGKPWGYGRVKVSIDALREFDIAAIYRSEQLCAAPAVASAGAVQGYIDAYDATAAKAMGLDKPSVTGTDEIRDFFFLKRTIRPGDEVSYMTLPEYQNVGCPLPAAADFRKEAEEAIQAAAAATAASEDNSLEAMKVRLAQRFNSK